VGGAPDWWIPLCLFPMLLGWFSRFKPEFNGLILLLTYIIYLGDKTFMFMCLLTDVTAVFFRLIHVHREEE